MKRRTFLENSSMLGLSLLAPQLKNISMSAKYKLGLQLYSINKDMNENTIPTLKAVKAMGYEDFEIYGFDPDKVSYYGIPATDFKNLMDDMELTVSSGHYGFAPFLSKTKDELKVFVDQCIKGAKALKSPYITWPWIAPEQRTLENFKKMPELLNIIGEQVTQAGLGFAYHNHGFEFETYGEEMGFDIIVNETDPDLVKLQMDMYWVMHGKKTTPKKLIEAQPGRYVMWHIKDMDKVTRDYTELGNGSIDYVDILPDPAKSGLEYYYIEQGGNFAESPMKSAAQSIEYLKKNLQQFL